MSREEAAAKAIFDIRDDAYDEDEWEDLDSTDRELFDCQSQAALAASDAFLLSDATVERAARAIFPSYWDDDAAECFETPEALAECQKGCTDHVRAVLAAAVEAGQ